MPHISNLKPFKVFGPGTFINEQMEIREWTQADLAEVLSMSPKHINALLNNKLRITTDMAQRLSGAFGQSANYWLNIDAGYQLHKSANQTMEEIAKKKATIYEHIPVLELIRLGWLKPTSNVDELSKQLCAFFKKETLDFNFMKNDPLPCFRKSEAHSQFSAYAAQCWYQMAKNTSGNFHAPAYNRKKLENLFHRIASFTENSKNINFFLDELNKTGVKFFILKHLQKTYLDGASFLCDKSPVIVYTARYDRTDNFWFTISHEIAHVLCHITSERDCFLDDITTDGIDKKEKDANRKAREALKQDKILRFFANKGVYIRDNAILECAQHLQLHPSVIAGALTYNRKIPFARIHKHSPKVMSCIEGSYKPLFT